MHAHDSYVDRCHDNNACRWPAEEIGVCRSWSGVAATADHLLQLTLSTYSSQWFFAIYLLQANIAGDLIPFACDSYVITLQYDRGVQLFFASALAHQLARACSGCAQPRQGPRGGGRPCFLRGESGHGPRWPPQAVGRV